MPVFGVDFVKSSFCTESFSPPPGALVQPTATPPSTCLLFSPSWRLDAEAAISTYAEAGNGVSICLCVEGTRRDGETNLLQQQILFIGSMFQILQSHGKVALWHDKYCFYDYV